MKQHFVTYLKALDQRLSGWYVRTFGERPGLLIFLFHRLFPDEKALHVREVDPLERLTVADFRLFLQYFLENGYRFVGQDSLLDGSLPPGRCVMVTIDDGYAGNAAMLPILREFRVPVLLFVSTSHVQQQKCFWWDALYRERARRNIPDDRITREILALKRLRADEVEATLKSEFGPDVLRPVGELDRPFTPRELATFAEDELVALGNHTADHAILTNYDEAGIRRQLQQAQEELAAMTGVVPVTVSYPNGNYDDAVCRIAAGLGLRLGMTIERRKNRLPVLPGTPTAMRLGRFILSGGPGPPETLTLARSDIQWYERLRSRLRPGY